MERAVPDLLLLLDFGRFSGSEKLARMELEAALARLPERERDIVILRFYSGLPSREVAARMGLSDGNVRYLQTQALRKLRAMLA